RRGGGAARFPGEPRALLLGAGRVRFHRRHSAHLDGKVPQIGFAGTVPELPAPAVGSRPQPPREGTARESSGTRSTPRQRRSRISREAARARAPWSVTAKRRRDSAPGVSPRVDVTSFLASSLSSVA